MIDDDKKANKYKLVTYTEEQIDGALKRMRNLHILSFSKYISISNGL